MESRGKATHWGTGLAAASLLLGLTCYLWLRPQGLGPSQVLGSLPAITHAFAFAALLLIVARPRRSAARYGLLAAWLVLLVAFEALQSPGAQPLVSNISRELHTGFPYLTHLLAAHGAGTFDGYDVIASVLGVALAGALIRPVPRIAPRVCH